MDSSSEPQAPRKSTRSRSRHWYHLRHPFRLVYQAVVAVVGAVIITLIIAVVFNQPIPGIDKSPEELAHLKPEDEPPEPSPFDPPESERNPECENGKLDKTA